MREFFGTDPSREEERQLKVGWTYRFLSFAVGLFVAQAFKHAPH